MKVLVTGTAGFIGFYTAVRYARDGHDVTGIDNINSYYDTALKNARLEQSGINAGEACSGVFVQSSRYQNYSFSKIDITDFDTLNALFAGHNFELVIHLAAQAGVRYALENPRAYVESNITGFFNILEACRIHKVPRLVFASSSSVYGLNTETPFSTSQKTDSPASFYAATKKADELLAFAYSHLHGMAVTGLRFFTVYGPWGRPDMAPFIFTKNITEGRPIKVFNNGNMKRDFTYIDDIIEGIVRTSELEPPPSPVPFRIYNIGRGSPVDLMEFIAAIEKHTRKRAVMEFCPMQNGDVPVTWADTADLELDTGYRPATAPDEGVFRFVEWYKDFYQK